MMNFQALRPLFEVNLRRPIFGSTWSRSFYYKFKRTRTPPLPEPKESPYIVGPYLKPSYLPVSYVTDPIKTRWIDDLDHLIYEPIKIERDEERRVQLLLIEDVEGFGVAGQVVEAPYRLGASKLIAMKKAEYFSEFATSWYKFGPKTAESASSALSPRTARLLRSQIFNLPIAPSTSIKPWHISLSLRLAGCYCPINVIHENSIDEFFDENDKRHVKCKISINNHEIVEVKFAFEKEEEEEKVYDPNN